MLFGKCPYEGKSIANLINLIDDSSLIFHESHPISDTMKNLLREMLSKDPKRRIEWEKLYDIVMEKNTNVNANINKNYEDKTKKLFANLNVFIPQSSPRKWEHQCISLDNTPSIEMNPSSFNQTIMNLNSDQGFSKPTSTTIDKNLSNFYKPEQHSSSFAKEQSFHIPSNTYSDLPQNSINGFDPIHQKNLKAENAVKQRDSIHSSFHKNEKIELVFSKIYKIEIKHAILNVESLLKFFAKERNKLVFISKVFFELSNYKLMNNSEIFEVNFHKYLYFHARNFKEMLLDHISLDVINVIANYNELCNSYEYKIVKELFKEEIDKIINSFLLHKEKAQLNKNIKNLDKIEIEGIGYINLKNFYKNILDYIVLVKENFMFSKEEKYKSEDSLKYMIHAIEMLDSVLLNELFDNFIDEDENLENQKYFNNLRKSKFSGLLKILNQKMDYFKRKYLQE